MRHAAASPGTTVRCPRGCDLTAAGAATFSPDGGCVAFQLSRPRNELHFADGHPWSSSEVAVLGLSTGGLAHPGRLRGGVPVVVR